MLQSVSNNNDTHLLLVTFASGASYTNFFYYSYLFINSVIAWTRSSASASLSSNAFTAK